MAGESIDFFLTAGNLSEQTGGSTKLPENLRHQTIGPSWVNEEPASAVVMCEWRSVNAGVCDIHASQTNSLLSFYVPASSVINLCGVREGFNDIFQMRNGVSV